MKNILNYRLLSVIILMSAFSACKPYYRCGETPPDQSKFKNKTAAKMTSKRTKAVIGERDALCLDLKHKNTENEKLREHLELEKKTIAKLDGDLQGLQLRYDKLLNESLSKTEQLSEALKAKSKELEEKEKLLSQREKALKEMQDMLSRQDSITNRLNEILRNALLGFSADDLSVEIKNGKVYVSMSDKLLFRSGRADIEEEGKKALRVLADVLNKNPEIDILIEGHTDNVPIRTALFKDNWDLSVARATSIVRILSEDYKVVSQRLTAAGKGEFVPRASNDTPEGRARNRRTEIILSPKLDELMNMIKVK
jgi:chemotaxis protein MotB